LTEKKLYGEDKAGAQYLGCIVMRELLALSDVGATQKLVYLSKFPIGSPYHHPQR
jgi:hypothetical protein